MSWQPLDCHAHSTMSDGSLSPSEVVDRANERGVRPTVSDHISRDVARALKSVSDVERYLDTLDAYPVMRGGEFCWHDTLWREIPDDLAHRFTHWIGSLHAVFLPDRTLVHAFARHVGAELTADAYMESHIDNLEQLTREMPIDVLAHPTLVPLPFRSVPPEELWTEERERRAARALAEANIAFELSNRYRPHVRFVRRVVDEGGRLALGSDGHTAKQVADIAFPLAMARELGVPDADLYDPLVHGSRTQRGSTRSVV
jgi:histidinol phosphatase-like PHP family hydrolase